MPAADLNRQVVVVGSANLDLTVAVSRLPGEGETVLGGRGYGWGKAMMIESRERTRYSSLWR